VSISGLPRDLFLRKHALAEWRASIVGCAFANVSTFESDKQNEGK
jgi:hypothetical protein